RSAASEDDVGRERGQFCRVPANFAVIGRGPAGIDAHVAADGPAQERQRLQERPNAGLPFRIVRRCGQKHANAPNPLALLRLPRERPRRRSAAEQRDELAPLHSMTSSARTINVIGTWSPIALAALRLRISSNFVGCSTGRLEGLAPRRILST